MSCVLYWLSLPKVAVHLYKVKHLSTLSRHWTCPHPVINGHCLSPEVGSSPLKMNGIQSFCHCVSLVV